MNRSNLDQSSRVAVTLPQFLMSTQPKGSRGEFTLLMTALQTAVKVVEKNIRQAGMQGSFGYIYGSSNSTGDQQAKLDVIANNTFKLHLEGSECICVLVSEEEDKPTLVDSKIRGNYIICFDPLDGSSNIDANVTVGSIWGIWRCKDHSKLHTPADVQKAFLRTGNELVSAGYAMYGSATNLVITTGQGVHGFTLENTIGEFLLTHPNIRIPKARRIYSMNEGNFRSWKPWIQKYVHFIKQEAPVPYAARYIGSMVGDVHRTLLYGGIFCYPADEKSPQGKLRYLYEAAPMAMIMEQAGGKAMMGHTRILDHMPRHLHDKVPVFIGSVEEVDLCLSYLSRYGKDGSSKL